ncbi:hypothetical protein AAC387_Pa03g1911 [Persea americana]
MGVASSGSIARQHGLIIGVYKHGRDVTAQEESKVFVDGTSYHRPCFKCSHGGFVISPSNYVAHEVCTASTITLSSSRQRGISASLANMKVTYM